MKRHANLLCLGAAVALLNACAPAVNAPEPVFPIPEKNKSEGLKKGKGATLCSNLC